MKTNKMGKKELLLLVVIFVVILVVAVMFYGKEKETGSTVIVTVDNEVYGTYNLNENQDVEVVINGEVTNYLVIKDGYADVIDANCPDHLCVNMKSIANDGETIVCLPNKMIVEVDGNNQSDLDVIVQ